MPNTKPFPSLFRIIAGCLLASSAPHCATGRLPDSATNGSPTGVTSTLPMVPDGCAAWQSHGRCIPDSGPYTFSVSSCNDVCSLPLEQLAREVNNHSLAQSGNDCTELIELREMLVQCNRHDDSLDSMIFTVCSQTGFCNANRPQQPTRGCTWLGYLYHHGIGTPPSAELAARFYDLEPIGFEIVPGNQRPRYNFQAYIWAAELWKYGISTDKTFVPDPARAKRLAQIAMNELQAGCPVNAIGTDYNEFDPVACRVLRDIYLRTDGLFTTHSPELAEKLASIAQPSGLRERLNYAESLASGKQKDYNQLAATYDALCKIAPSTCSHLADMKSCGCVFERNLTESKSLYQQAGCSVSNSENLESRC